jgi:hypothetical protein
VSVASVRAELGSDAELVTIEEIGKVVKVAFREYIHGDEGKKAWNRVNRVVKDLGGVWVPEGRLSRWQIPRKSEGAKSTVTSDKKALLVKDALEYLETVQTQVGYAIEKLKELQK